MTRVILTVVVLLTVFSMTACAKKDRLSHDKSTIKKCSQGTSIDKKTTIAKSAPSQKMLDEVLSNTKNIRVLDCGLCEDGKLCKVYNETIRERSSGKVLFESSEQMVLDDLTRYLRIVDSPQYPENSRTFQGTPTFELTLVDGSKVYIGLIGSNLRWNAWNNDAYLLHPVALIIWLGEHGALKPIRDLEARFDYAKHIYRRDVLGFDKFVQAMPKSLQVFFGPLKRLDSSACLEDMSQKHGKIPEEMRLKLARAALSREFPNESDQIGVLLEWDGKITYDWASYQSFPIKLLLEYDPSQVLSKVKGSSLTPEQWVGVCRYYSYLNFRQKFPSGYKPLDKALKARIIREVKATGKHDYDVDDFKYAMRHWIP